MCDTTAVPHPGVNAQWKRRVGERERGREEEGERERGRGHLEKLAPPLLPDITLNINSSGQKQWHRKKNNTGASNTNS